MKFFLPNFIESIYISKLVYKLLDALSSHSSISELQQPTAMWAKIDD